MPLTTTWHGACNGVPATTVWTIACWRCGETDIDAVTLICSDCKADNHDDKIPDSAFTN